MVGNHRKREENIRATIYIRTYTGMATISELSFPSSSDIKFTSNRFVISTSSIFTYSKPTQMISFASYVMGNREPCK